MAAKWRGCWLAVGMLVVALVATTGCGDKKPAFPAWTSPVLDEAEFITPKDQDILNRFLLAYQEATGTQMAVYLARTLEGKDPATYATELAHHWGVGNKEKDTGLLVLIAVEDRSHFTAVGYGLEGVLPDVLVKNIQERTLVPQLKAGNPGLGLRLYLFALAERAAPEVAGITPGLLALLEVGTGTVEPEMLPEPEPLGWSDILTLLGFAGFFGLMFLHARRYRRRSGGSSSTGGGWGSSRGSSGGSSGGSFGGGSGGGFGGGGAGGKW